MAISIFDSVKLNAVAADGATEIFLIDANLRRIATGVGKLEKRVMPGLYKVRFRSGASQHDELVEVSGKEEQVRVNAPPILFKATAPIDATHTNHEYQSRLARRESQKSHLRMGVGGELFLFLRETSENESASDGHITIHSLNGKELASIRNGFVEPQARVKALNIELSPGTYSIRVTTGSLGSYEIFVTVCQGWQTQAFLVNEDFWNRGERIRSPSLRLASLLMSRQGQGFDPSREVTRFAELARQALIQGRNVISTEQMNHLLYGKFEDPMLGVIAGHLLLRRTRPNRNLLAILCNNLQNLLGTHPDVQSLLLNLKDSSFSRVETIKVPPSLRQSWEAIVKASRRRASLVPSNSYVAKVAEDIVTGGPWLIRRVEETASVVNRKHSTIADARRMAQSLLVESPDKLHEMRKLKEGDLNGLERSLLNSIVAFSQETIREDPISNVNVKRKPPNLLKIGSAPKYAAANAVMGLAKKLKQRNE
ncbi:MAG: hypothetical protein IH613_13365 [Desulfuromonadales bacterium]|nr:hypothetical protein [Desulfuromonadales bacterium]